MSNILSFESLKYQDILEPEFQNLSFTEHNCLEFKMTGQCGMAVVYAPNGTGKTTLTNLLGMESSSGTIDFLAFYNFIPITPTDKKFHIIGD